MTYIHSFFPDNSWCTYKIIVVCDKNHDDDSQGRQCWPAFGGPTTIWTWPWPKRWRPRPLRGTNLTTDSDNKVKSALLDVQPNLFKFYDQRILQFKVFPLVGTSFLRWKNTRFDSKDQRRVNVFHFAQVRDLAAIYDSYNCGIIWKFGHCRPWPTKRQGFRFNKPTNLFKQKIKTQTPHWNKTSNWIKHQIKDSQRSRYVGYGPTKNYAVKALRRKRCPVKCRPEAHKDWEYCWPCLTSRIIYNAPQWLRTCSTSL